MDRFGKHFKRHISQQHIHTQALVLITVRCVSDDSVVTDENKNDMLQLKN